MTETYRSLTLEEAEVLWQLGCEQFEWAYVNDGVWFQKWIFTASPALEHMHTRHNPSWKKQFRIEVQQEQE